MPNKISVGATFDPDAKENFFQAARIKNSKPTCAANRFESSIIYRHS